MIKTLTWVLAAVFIFLGITGYFQNPALGLFEIDQVHNIIHLISGILAIVAVLSGESYARLFLIVFGIVYALVAVLGFAMNGNILSIFTTNRNDDYLHTVIALACLAVGFGEKK